MSATDNKRVVLEYLDALCRGDRERAWAAFAEDATWKTPPSLPWPSFYRGRQAIFDEYFAVDKGIYTTGSDRYQLEVLSATAEGERVAVELRHRGQGLNGRPYDTEHSLVFELRDGRIQAVREYIDSLYLQRSMLE
jgi:ketosteroid isomerase-like protein